MTPFFDPHRLDRLRGVAATTTVVLVSGDGLEAWLGAWGVPGPTEELLNLFQVKAFGLWEGDVQAYQATNTDEGVQPEGAIL